ncbi:hypothetical protein VPNG_09133 [Cytospora leucostoma]|uniref:Uncharacterized protein n=1 Tax=Cytospora leucostoma TaxID=1230097 RepID=A0A423VYD1_9PEZI|nr:hypothetical protein VPNG_09133 [Cytospora leucostoma]
MSLVEFKDLGDSILLYEPRHKLDGGSHESQEYVETRPGSPGLIILCTWLGGATSKRIERLRPAYREIRRIALDPYSTSKERSIDGGILLHIMSQGGTNMATHLITSLNKILGFVGRDVPLPLRQIVLDSCPGDPDIKSTYAAGVHSLPRGHPLVQPLGCAVMYVIAASIAGLEATGLRKSTARIMRKQLNDPKIFSPGAARLYLTSRADKIVDFRQVEAHAEQAASEGLKTEIVVFDRAGHCCLMLEDDIAYWNAIVSCWERSGPPSLAETPREGMVEGAHSHQDSFRVRLNEGRSRL